MPPRAVPVPFLEKFFLGRVLSWKSLRRVVSPLHLRCISEKERGNAELISPIPRYTYNTRQREVKKADCSAAWSAFLPCDCLCACGSCAPGHQGRPPPPHADAGARHVLAPHRPPRDRRLPTCRRLHIRHLMRATATLSCARHATDAIALGDESLGDLFYHPRALHIRCVVLLRLY